MTPAEFAKRIDVVDSLRATANKLIALSNDMEDAAESDVGVIYASREPGFDQWTAYSLPGFYATRGEVVRELYEQELLKQADNKPAT